MYVGTYIPKGSGNKKREGREIDRERKKERKKSRRRRR